MLRKDQDLRRFFFMAFLSMDINGVGHWRDYTHLGGALRLT